MFLSTNSVTFGVSIRRLIFLLIAGSIFLLLCMPVIFFFWMSDVIVTLLGAGYFLISIIVLEHCFGMLCKLLGKSGFFQVLLLSCFTSSIIWFLSTKA